MSSDDSRQRSPPTRRLELTIRLHADDKKRLLRELREIVSHLQEGIDNQISAGDSAGYTFRLREHPAVTPESYKASLETWMEERQRTHLDP